MADTWRQHYAPQIADIINSNKELKPKEIKKILQKNNPGQYGHMRKIWSDESLKQLGLKRTKVLNIDANQIKLY